MYKTIIAAEIKRKFNIEPLPEKRCFIDIGEADSTIQHIEMVYQHSRGAADGYVWYFICPETGIRCRKLILLNGQYIHTSKAKNYYRDIKPLWLTGKPMDRILKLKQAEIDAQKILDRKYFKTHYAGKPTKLYSKCLKDIAAANGITMHGIINGAYE